MAWVASTLHTTSEHGVYSITTADVHISAASSRLNWRPNRFKWTRPFRRKTKSGFCACAITFQTQSTNARNRSTRKKTSTSIKLSTEKFHMDWPRMEIWPPQWEAGDKPPKPCYVMLCYVMLCYVMLCYVTLRDLFSLAQQPYSSLGRLTVEVSRSSCQLAFSGYPDWCFSLLFPQL